MIPCSLKQCQDVQDTLFHLEWALTTLMREICFGRNQYALRIIPRSRLKLIKLELIFKYIKSIDSYVGRMHKVYKVNVERVVRTIELIKRKLHLF